MWLDGQGVQAVLRVAVRLGEAQWHWTGRHMLTKQVPRLGLMVGLGRTGLDADSRRAGRNFFI